MSAADLYHAGKLDEAIDAQLQAVKKSPTDEGQRVFLFELLAFAGDLDRAGRQLQAVSSDDPQKQAVQAVFLNLLEAEKKRRQVFAGSAKPRFFTDPPHHVQLRLEALTQFCSSNPAGAAEVLKQAEGQTPALRGDLNGQPFDVLRDCDDLFGTVLEVLAHGEYFWVPLDQVESIGLNAPQYPRELLWLPARVTLRDGPTGDVFLPVLYPGTHEQAGDDFKLGRVTDWKQADGGPARGVGAKLFLVGDVALGLPEWRQLTLLPA